MGRSSVEAVSDHSSDDLHQLTQFPPKGAGRNRSAQTQRGRFPPSRAFLSYSTAGDDDDEGDEECGEGDVGGEEGDDGDAACMCHSCDPNDEFGHVVDRLEQDIVCAFVSAACHMCDEEVCEDIAEGVHARVRCVLRSWTGATARCASRKNCSQLPSPVRAGGQDLPRKGGPNQEELYLPKLWRQRPHG